MLSVAPAPPVDGTDAGDAVALALVPVLQQVVTLLDAVAAEVDVPLPPYRPVVVRREPRALPVGRLTVVTAAVPSVRCPGTRVTVTFPGHVDQQRAVGALKALLAATLDLELDRQESAAAARTALEAANRDPGTGLGNRRAWASILRLEAQRCLRSRSPFTVVVLDLDGLKQVNDTRGHAAGDELITATASVLRQQHRAIDHVCRLGGDEFGIAAPGTDGGQAQALMAKLRQRLRERGISVSLGAATMLPSGQADDGGLDQAVHALWQEADAAMYADKRAGASALHLP